MGDSYPKRGDREYIQNKAEPLFTTRNMPEELVDELFDIVNDRKWQDLCAGYRQKRHPWTCRE